MEAKTHYLLKRGPVTVTLPQCGAGLYRLIVGVTDESTDARDFEVRLVLSDHGNTTVPAKPVIRRIRQWDALEPEASERVSTVPSLYTLLELEGSERLEIEGGTPWVAPGGGDELPWFVQLVRITREQET